MWFNNLGLANSCGDLKKKKMTQSFVMQQILNKMVGFPNFFSTSEKARKLVNYYIHGVEFVNFYNGKCFWGYAEVKHAIIVCVCFFRVLIFDQSNVLFLSVFDDTKVYKGGFCSLPCGEPVMRLTLPDFQWLCMTSLLLHFLHQGTKELCYPESQLPLSSQMELHEGICSPIYQ